MVYLDSNVFIYPVIYEESVEKAKKAKEILDKLARGKLEGYSATLTWDEVVWVVLRTLGPSDAEEQGRKFLTFPNLTLVSVTEDVLKRAQAIIERHRLRPRDAIHAAASLEAGQKELISDDVNFDRIESLKRLSLT